MRGLALVALCACASAKPAPAPTPPPPDPVGLAAELHGELVEMATATHAARGTCPQMATALRSIIVRMRASGERAQAMQADPAVAPKLVTAIHAYDRESQGMSDAIVGDLATCRDDPAVRALIDAMPTL